MWSEKEYKASIPIGIGADHGSRLQKTSLELLKNFKGTLHTDGYMVCMYENKIGVLPLDFGACQKIF